MTQEEKAIKKAEEIYLKITSYANYSQMNGIDKEWIVSQIAKGLIEFKENR